MIVSFNDTTSQTNLTPMSNLLQKLHIDKYVNVYVVFGIDMLLSAFASIMALLGLWMAFHSKDFYALPFLLTWLGAGMLGVGICFVLLKTYYAVIRHSNLREVGLLVLAVLGKETAIAASVSLTPLAGIYSFRHIVALLVLDGLVTITVLVMTRVCMILAYDIIRRRVQDRRSLDAVLIYGTGNKAISFVRTLQSSNKYDVVGFLVTGNRHGSHVIHGKHVFHVSGENDFATVVKTRRVSAVIFAHRQDARNEEDKLIRYCTRYKVKVLYSPSVEEVVGGKVSPVPVREIKIEDLLGRPEIRISLDEIRAAFQGKTVLVTGAAGSIGSELCRQLAGFGVKKLVLFDNAETPMHNFRLEMEERFPDLDFVPIIGDVRIPARLDYVFRDYHPQVVFHAAAYKHVPLMEENPCEAVCVNVAGSRNVADKCIEYDVEKMVMVSTDKAVNPTNIMGCTKRLAEIYVQSLGLAIEKGEVKGKTRFVTTRFGNVLGSNGSVIPRFREQITKGGPVTVTHPDITRFFMTIPEARRLVMEAATMSEGNQIYVFDMGASVKIAHLAERMIELAGFTPGRDIQIEYTGLRPGEKLYEEVLSDHENTLPTEHSRIRVAKVREYDYTDARHTADELEKLSRQVRIPDMVRLMKATVPEFRSKNSVFEKYDEERDAAKGKADK